MNKPFILLLAIISTWNFATSQTDNVTKLDQITISLNANGVRSVAYPFDVPFYLVGNIPDNCNSITFSYKPHDTIPDHKSKYPSWISLPRMDGPVSPDGYYGEVHWQRTSGDTMFSLPVQGLHPNIPYDFKLVMHTSLNLDSVKRGLIKEKLVNRIIEFINNHNGTSFTKDQREELNADLMRILKTELALTKDQKLLNKADEKALLTGINNNTLLKDSYEALDEALTIKYDAEQNFQGLISKSLIEWSKQSDKIRTVIDLALSDKSQLSPISKEILNTTFSPGIKDFKSYTYRDGLKLLRKICLTPAYFSEIANGNLKILNTDFIETDKVDIASLEFLYSLLTKVSDQELKIIDKGKENTLFIDIDLKNLIASVNTCIKYQKTVVENIAIAEKIKREFPDLTAVILISETLISEAISISDVETEKTPYISAEAGIGYSTSFQSAFRYFGANFYLSPVNKRARIGSFKGWNRFKKVTSFHLGIANSFASRPNNAYSFLGDGSNSDLVFGIGFRTGRILKLNLNWIPYYTTNENPLNSNRKLKLDFSPSIGLDINLLGALGDVASALNLIK